MNKKIQKTTTVTAPANPIEKFRRLPDDLKIEVVPVFSQAIADFMSGCGDEVGGYFLVEDGQVVWWQKALNGTMGRVTGDKEYAIAAAQCVAETGLSPNGQWHTHPDMGVFWSGTDTNDQARTVEMSMNTAAQFGIESGEMYFIVLDSLDWLVRKFAWDNEGISYADGQATLSGNLLDSGPRWQRSYYSYGPYDDWLDQEAFIGIGDIISFPCKDGVRRSGLVEVEETDKDGQVNYRVEADEKMWIVPASIATLESDDWWSPNRKLNEGGNENELI